jgi:hypothetical protein
LFFSCFNAVVPKENFYFSVLLTSWLFGTVLCLSTFVGQKLQKPFLFCKEPAFGTAVKPYASSLAFVASALPPQAATPHGLQPGSVQK